jgi:hypothetical protein
MSISFHRGSMFIHHLGDEEARRWPQISVRDSLAASTSIKYAHIDTGEKLIAE